MKTSRRPNAGNSSSSFFRISFTSTWIIFTTLLFSLLMILTLFNVSYLQTSSQSTAFFHHSDPNERLTTIASHLAPPKVSEFFAQWNTYQVSESSSATDSISAFDCPADCTTCFMYQCICTGAETEGPQCLNAGTYSFPNFSIWIEELRANYRRDLAMSAISDDPHYVYWQYIGFSYFAMLPLNLGDVLEIGVNSVPLSHHILNTQPRSIDSLTLWDPYVHAYAAQASNCPYANSTMDNLEGLKLIGLTLDEFRLRSSYDTIILFNSTQKSFSPLRFLENVYHALRPDGHIILFETYTKFPGARGQQTHFTKELLRHFTKFFTPVYHNDERAYSRVRKTNLIRYIPLELDQVNAFYFIGKKKSIDEVYDQHQQLFLTPRIIRNEVQLTATSPLQFYLTWSTHKLMTWRMLVLDSIFHHHPNAHITIYSDDLYEDQATTFQQFLDRKFSVSVRMMNFTEIFGNTPIYDWVMVPEHREKLNFISDAIRLAVVYKYGGIYIDFDAIVLRPLHNLQNMIARELPKGMVNGALLPFPAGHPFLAIAMIRFPQKVNLERYTSGGPRLQSDSVHLYAQINPSLVMYKQHPEDSDIDIIATNPYVLFVYQPDHFFANWWHEAANYAYWKPELLNTTQLNLTLRNQYIFHIWKQMLGKTLDSPTDYVYRESFMGQIFERNCEALCDEFKAANPGKDVVTLPRLKTKEEQEWREKENERKRKVGNEQEVKRMNDEWAKAQLAEKQRQIALKKLKELS